MLFYLAYVSSATRLLSRADLDDILLTSRRNNQDLGVSGALLYQDGNVMQVLEGAETEARLLYGRIGLDPRHKDLITVLHGFQDERQFPDWSMAFHDVGRDLGKSLDEYNPFLDTQMDPKEFGSDPALSQRLLLSFKTSLGLH